MDFRVTGWVLRALVQSTLAFSCVAAMSAAAGPAASGFEPQATVDLIESTWRNRQARFQNMWVEYETLVRKPKGQNSLTSPTGERIYPPGDTQFTCRSLFVLDGDWSRFECWGVYGGSHVTGQWEPQHYVSVYNRSGNRTFSEPTESASPEVYPIGWDCPGQPNTRGYNVWPIIAAYRSLDFGSGTLRLRGSTLASGHWINGAECLRLSTELGNGQTQLAWLDPAWAYLPVRIEQFNPQDARHVEPWLGLQVEIEYEQHASLGIGLRGWRSMLFADTARPEDVGLVANETTSTVTSTRVNTPLEPSVFEVEFPEGCQVNDCSGGAPYLLLKGGRRRPILPAEREAGLSHAQLVSSEPGELVPPVVGRSRLSATWWLLVIGIVALGGLAVLAFRRVRKFARRDS